MEEKDYDSYIEKTFKGIPEENKPDMINALKKYGENRWWESSDLITIATYQLFEPILMVSFPLFHKGLEKLLDRPVFTSELGLNYEGLKQEAQLAIQRIKQGLQIGDEQREEAVLRSIKQLEDHCKKNGKQFLKIDLSNKSENEVDESDYTNNDNGDIDTSGYDGWLNPNDRN